VGIFSIARKLGRPCRLTKSSFRITASKINPFLPAGLGLRMEKPKKTIPQKGFFLRDCAK
jgi:hypothetical protein